MPSEGMFCIEFSRFYWCIMVVGRRGCFYGEVRGVDGAEFGGFSRDG